MILEVVPNTPPSEKMTKGKKGKNEEEYSFVLFQRRG